VELLHRISYHVEFYHVTHLLFLYYMAEHGHCIFSFILQPVATWVL